MKFHENSKRDAGKPTSKERKNENKSNVDQEHNIEIPWTSWGFINIQFLHSNSIQRSHPRKFKKRKYNPYLHLYNTMFFTFQNHFTSYQQIQLI